MASSAAFGAAVLMFGVGSGVAEACGSCACKTTYLKAWDSKVETEEEGSWNNNSSRWVKVSESQYTSHRCKSCVQGGGDNTGDDDIGCYASYNNYCRTLR